METTGTRDRPGYRPVQTPAQPRDAGMSLLELLVVLAIVSLAYALVLPSMRNPTRSVALRAVAQNISSQLTTLRARSIAAGRPQGVTFDVANHRYRLDADSRNVELPRDVGVRITAGRGLSRDGAGSARIVFYPDGSSSGGNIRLEQEGRAVEIGVEWLTGHVQVVR